MRLDKKLLLPGLLALALVGQAGDARAFTWYHHRSDPVCQPLAPGTCFVEKKVTAYKPVWKEEKVQVEVTRLEWKKETVPVKVTEMVNKERIEERTVIVHKAVAKIEERDMPYCVRVQECVLCPYTCCPQFITRPQIVIKKEKVTVFQDVAEPTKEKVKVHFCEAVEKTIQQERLVPDYKKEKMTETRKTCVLEPYTTVIQVPVGFPGCGPCSPFGPNFSLHAPSPGLSPALGTPTGPSSPVSLFQYLNSTGPQVTPPWSSPSSGNGPMPTFPTGMEGQPPLFPRPANPGLAPAPF